jgi:hypothetical protein
VVIDPVAEPEDLFFPVLAFDQGKSLERSDAVPEEEQILWDGRALSGFAEGLVSWVAA